MKPLFPKYTINTFSFIRIKVYKNDVVGINGTQASNSHTFHNNDLIVDQSWIKKITKTHKAYKTYLHRLIKDSFVALL